MAQWISRAKRTVGRAGLDRPGEVRTVMGVLYLVFNEGYSGEIDLWYDVLLRFADTPIIRLNRAVAVGEADGAPAGLSALADVDENIPGRDAVAAHLHERNGDLELAARLYASAARNAPNLAERDHQTRQAARLHDLLRHQR
jgi:predicted RNA polymerase sigma factor